jgi:hypothetical protein
MASHNRSTIPTPRRRPGSEFVVIKELEPLRASPQRRLVVRILQGDRGRRLDIREFVDEQGYHEPTRKGINIDAEQFAVLLEQAGAIKRLLDGGAR